MLIAQFVGHFFLAALCLCLACALDHCAIDDREHVDAPCYLGVQSFIPGCQRHELQGGQPKSANDGGCIVVSRQIRGMRFEQIPAALCEGVLNVHVHDG